MLFEPGGDVMLPSAAFPLRDATKELGMAEVSRRNMARMLLLIALLLLRLTACGAHGRINADDSEVRA